MNIDTLLLVVLVQSFGVVSTGNKTEARGHKFFGLRPILKMLTSRITLYCSVLKCDQFLTKDFLFNILYHFSRYWRTQARHQEILILIERTSL